MQDTFTNAALAQPGVFGEDWVPGRTGNTISSHPGRIRIPCLLPRVCSILPALSTRRFCVPSLTGRRHLSLTPVKRKGSLFCQMTCHFPGQALKFWEDQDVSCYTRQAGASEAVAP